MLNEVLKFLRIDNVQTTLAKIQNEIIINGEQKNNLINEICLNIELIINNIDNLPQILSENIARS